MNPDDGIYPKLDEENSVAEFKVLQSVVSLEDCRLKSNDEVSKEEQMTVKGVSLRYHRRHQQLG